MDTQYIMLYKRLLLLDVIVIVSAIIVNVVLLLLLCRWFGKCWHIQDLLKYEFDIEFDVSIKCILLIMINGD